MKSVTVVSTNFPMEFFHEILHADLLWAELDWIKVETTIFLLLLLLLLLFVYKNALFHEFWLMDVMKRYETTHTHVRHDILHFYCLK